MNAIYIITYALWGEKLDRIWVIRGERCIGCNVKQAGQDRPHEETFGQRSEEGEGVFHTNICGKGIKLPSTMFRFVSK